MRSSHKRCSMLGPWDQMLRGMFAGVGYAECQAIMPGHVHIM